jgi:hypothetical protein
MFFAGWQPRIVQEFAWQPTDGSPRPRCIRPLVGRRELLKIIYAGEPSEGSAPAFLDTFSTVQRELKMNVSVIPKTFAFKDSY